MSAWWDTLTGLEHALFIIASIATLLLVIQIILILFGFSHDGDVDFDDFDGGLSIFTVKGLTAFFAVGGWSGMVASTNGLKEIWTVLIAFLAGILALFTVYIIFRQINRLQSAGNLNFDKAVGKTATVYVAIPENMSGKGKITLTLQERFIEIDAMTHEKKRLKTDDLVTITEIIGADTVIVKPIK